MKYICVFLCVLVAVVCVSGQGIPTKKCPPGEHSVLYCPRTLEPDCEIPTLRNGPGACDIPDCFCNPPAVRERRSGRCVPPHNCPQNVPE